ncbi:endonuclease domain-containing protein [Undibacterium arcticum]
MRRIQEQTTANARSLRSDMTDVERMLWRALRGKQLEHSRFRRQHPIGPYIADFACLDKKLVIELDGGQHQDRIAYDARRTAFFLQLQGWQVVRFWNNDVLNNLDGVLATVVDALNGIHPA